MKSIVLPQYLVLFTFFMCFTLLLHAQQIKRDIVYLKNGSIIKGTILEMIPNQTIKIETADGSIFIYKLEEVEKTTIEIIEKGRRGARDRINAEKTNNPEKKENFSPTGYFLLVKLGPALYPELFIDGITYSVSLINGLQINKHMSIGIGIESTSYIFDRHTFTNTSNQNSVISISSDKNKKSQISITPFFFDARFYLPLQRIHPMFDFQLGYSIVGNRQQDPYYYYSGFIPKTGPGGIYMSFGAGIRLFITTKISLIADGGITFQGLQGYTNTYNGAQQIDQTKTITSMKVNVGAVFSFGKNKKTE